jgi:hypothetical protein
MRMVDVPGLGELHRHHRSDRQVLRGGGGGVDEQLAGGQRGRTAAALHHPQDDRAGQVVGGHGGEVGQRVPDLELAL